MLDENLVEDNSKIISDLKKLTRLAAKANVTIVGGDSNINGHRVTFVLESELIIMLERLAQLEAIAGSRRRSFSEE